MMISIMTVKKILKEEKVMKINKKIKCLHCQNVVEENGKCECGIVILSNNIIVEGKLGIDYEDMSAILLNE